MAGWPQPLAVLPQLESRAVVAHHAIDHRRPPSKAGISIVECRWILVDYKIMWQVSYRLIRQENFLVQHIGSCLLVIPQFINQES